MIDSVNNEKIVYFRKLREAKYIKEEGKYIVETEHLVNEAYNAGILESLIIENSADFDLDVPKTIVSRKCMEKISLLKNAPSVMGVVKLKENNTIKGNKIVVLDNVQDPGNVGTIIRSSLAFNVDTVILSKDSVNVFNDKLIRSSEGTIFNVNIVVMDTIEAINTLHEMKIDVYYADMYGENEVSEIKPEKYALVLGSEGKGISKAVKEMADKGVKLQMNSKCESLNVAVAGSIIMHAWR